MAITPLMQELDSEVTTAALFAFQEAWQLSISDYAEQRINSEHTLQATIYHHLRMKLPDRFSVFTEAVIHLPENTTEETGKRKVVLDLLICLSTEIVAAIELKYTPRGEPSVESMRKDVLSLSRVTNRRKIVDRVEIEMPRFRSVNIDTMQLTISPLRKLVLAIYCREEALALSVADFWSPLRPDHGYWEPARTPPRNLGIAFARTNSAGSARAEYLGGPFDRLSRIVASERETPKNLREGAVSAVEAAELTSGSQAL